MNDKPLVTIAMMTYNQEKYVRESVRGMLSQTYEPLEIVISDDCSSDRTWDIILEEVQAYKDADGVHKNIVLNRNEKNLGIARHFEKWVSLCHGVLLVCNGGDDISVSDRVERIVAAWMAQDGNVSLLIHSAFIINKKGQTLGILDERSIEHPLGAVSTYNRFLFMTAGFGGIVEPEAYEDLVFARRAQMIGMVMSIPDKLLYYRVGSGISSIAHKRREVEIRGAKARIASCWQTRLDLEVRRNKITSEMFHDISQSNERWIEFSESRLRLFGGKTLSERFQGFKECSKGRKFGLGTLLFAIYVLPSYISDPVMDTYTGLKNWIKAISHKCVSIRVRPSRCVDMLHCT